MQVRGTELVQIQDHAQRAPNQPPDFLRAPLQTAGVGLALRARLRRARQEGIFARNPAAAAFHHPGGHFVLDGGRAKHARLTHRNQRRAFRIVQIVRCDHHWPQLIVGATIYPSHVSSSPIRNHTNLPESQGKRSAR